MEPSDEADTFRIGSTNKSKIPSWVHTVRRNDPFANVMERASKISSMTPTTAPATATTEFVRVPMTYPSWRRQKRCSYYVAQLLESLDTDHVQRLRHTLLHIPSTKQRMSYVLRILEKEVDIYLSLSIIDLGE